MARRGRKLGTTCAVCRLGDGERVRLEALRCSGASLDSLAKKFGVSRDSVFRHMRSHCTPEMKTSYLAGPATIAELKERAAQEGGSILDYLGVLRSILMGAITSSAEAKSAATLAMLSGRLIETLREIGKLTGEIDRLNPSINVTTNVAIMSDPKMIELQSGLLSIARSHPDVRSDVVSLLRGLEGGTRPQASASARSLIDCEVVDAT